MWTRLDRLAEQNVSREGFTRKILARHSCLHLACLFAFQSYARHMLLFAGCLVASYLWNLFNLQLLESSYSLSLFNTQPLQWNPTINTGYKRLNNITIKFDTEYKPTKHNVVNNNFTFTNLQAFIIESWFCCYYYYLLLLLLLLRALVFGLWTIFKNILLGE